MKSLGKRFQRMGKSYLCTFADNTNSFKLFEKIVALLDTYYNVY